MVADNSISQHSFRRLLAVILYTSDTLYSHNAVELYVIHPSINKTKNKPQKVILFM